MTPEEILKHPARVLTQAQREHYFEKGYVGVESLVPSRHHRRTQRRHRRVRRPEPQGNRSPARSSTSAPATAAEQPVLRRLKRPDERHEAYWRFATGLMADVAADLARPQRRLPSLEAELQMVRRKRHGEVAPGHPVLPPHQLQRLHDRLLPRRHRHEQRPPRRPARQPRTARSTISMTPTATGPARSSDADAAAIDMSKVDYLMGPAGSITIHNCRALHYSPSSKSPMPRPLLLNCYSSADAQGLHAASRSLGPRLRSRPRRGAPVGRTRPPPLPDSAGLVRRLHLDLRGPGRRRHDVTLAAGNSPRRAIGWRALAQLHVFSRLDLVYVPAA